MTEIRIPDHEKNTMFYWYPIVQKCGILSPKTVLFPFKGKLEYKIFDGKKSKEFDAFVKQLEAEADKIGYPLFMRTDETSNKYEWKNSCYVESKEQIHGHLLNILEMIEMSMGLGFKGVALREFLTLESAFTSHNGMPVAKEFRLFVRDGKLECIHPYWPKASIHSKEPNWDKKIYGLRVLTADDLNAILKELSKFGSELHGYWSVDFCRTQKQEWYLTDMAVGKDSYHWATCEYAPKEMLAAYGEPDNLKPKTDFNDILDTLSLDVPKLTETKQP